MPGGPVNMHERLITIQGNPVNINIAVGLLHAVSRRSREDGRVESLLNHVRLIATRSREGQEGGNDARHGRALLDLAR